MAGKIYHQLSCRDAGVDCDFLVRAETKEEVLRVAGDHACRSHQMCEFTPEMKEKVSSKMKTVSL
jgi:predicted small metal-binding protein